MNNIQKIKAKYLIVKTTDSYHSSQLRGEKLDETTELVGHANTQEEIEEVMTRLALSCSENVIVDENGVVSYNDEKVIFEKGDKSFRYDIFYFSILSQEEFNKKYGQLGNAAYARCMPYFLLQG